MRTYVFPTADQLTSIRVHDTGGHYLVLTHPDVPLDEEPSTGIIDVTTRDFDSRMLEKSSGLLCLNELALYFATRERLSPDRCGFAPECLAALTKIPMGRLLSAAGLPVPPRRRFRLSAPPAVDPPFVVKPNFGFASQLVCRIDTTDQWEKYVALAADEDAWPLRARYASEFFEREPDILDHFIIEPDLSDGMFFSIPFVFDGETTVSFPVQGWHASGGPATSFAWRAFRAPASIPNEAANDTEHQLTRLAAAVALRPGVYEVELLWRSGVGALYLEFSPRPTGGLVPDLVRHSYGVDLNELAVLAFLGRPPRSTRSPGVPHVGLRRTRDDPLPAVDGRLVSTTSRRSADREVRDEILRIG
jgi:ATP-grasp domain